MHDGKPEVNTNTLEMYTVCEPEERKSPDMKTVNKREVLEKFKVGFFSMSRLKSFPWTFLEEDLQTNKSSETISEILEETCLHPLCRKFPPSVTFRRKFLSELIKRLEASASEPLDQLYDALAEVVGAEETTESYKTYILPGGEPISLVENVALISEGTTGLVTWEAALYLSEWALDHRDTFRGRSVLELGSGVGLTGVTICRSCAPARFVFSDCHHSVLQKLRTNVQLSGLTEGGSPPEGSPPEGSPPVGSPPVRSPPEGSPPEVRVEELDWAEVSEERIRKIGAEVVIAADVVYDPDVVRTLVRLLSLILTCPSSKAVPEIFICSTIRNQETYSGFKLLLGEAGISHQVMDGDVNQVFPYDRSSHIEMIKVFR